MLSKKMQDALNEQINAEMWSAYLYLSMSADAENKALKGIANWFYVQFREEQDHARIIMNYITARGGRVELKPIAEVRGQWECPMEAFGDTLTHEKEVTAMIHDLCVMAEEEKDFATRNMLAWFVDEQVEEEESAQAVIDALKMVEGDKVGLYMIDRELGAREYEKAAPLGK